MRLLRSTAAGERTAAVIGMVTICACVATGCQGQARVNLLNMNLARVSTRPSDTKVMTLDCGQCVHWVDQDGRLNIAAHQSWPSILGQQFSREFYISFVVDKPTAGVGSNYKVKRPTIRGYFREGAGIYRFRSLYGSLAIDNLPQDELAGAFRARIDLRALQWLGGWSKSLPFMVFGTFRAKPDRGQAGPKIREKTEAKGWERNFVIQRITTTMPTQPAFITE